MISDTLKTTFFFPFIFYFSILAFCFLRVLWGEILICPPSQILALQLSLFLHLALSLESSLMAPNFTSKWIKFPSYMIFMYSIFLFFYFFLNFEIIVIVCCYYWYFNILNIITNILLKNKNLFLLILMDKILWCSCTMVIVLSLRGNIYAAAIWFIQIFYQPCREIISVESHW